MKSQILLNLRHRCTLFGHLAVIALLLGLNTALLGAPGDLDVTFGNGGVVTTPLVNPPNGIWATSMIVQPDGKIIVAGQLTEPGDEGDYFASFFIARYNPGGTLDDSFGANGKIIAPFDLGGQLAGSDIALQSDGKIIAVGTSYPYHNRGIVVHRYNPDGTLDTSFGVAGRVLTQLGGFAQAANRVGVMPDGRIVVAGYVYSDQSGANGAFAIIRYNADGSLDRSFGTNGTAITAAGTGGDVRVNAVLTEPNGRIIVAGARRVSGSDGRTGLTLLRYHVNGSLDAGFGSNGEVFQMIDGFHAIALDAVLQPDGKILASAWTYGHAVVRYNTDGSLDTTFADGGIFRMINGTGFYAGESLALQDDGKIVAFGYGFNGGDMGFGTLRLSANGTPDAAFGIGGRIITRIGAGGNDRPIDVAVQPDGKILAYGETWSNDNSQNIVLVRYQGGSAPSISGRVTTPTDLGLRNAVVSLTDQSGLRRTTATSSFGLFAFDNVAMGGTYTVSVSSRRYRFSSQTITANGNLANINFTALE